MCSQVIAFYFICLAAGYNAAPPALEWQYPVTANVYPAPLVAELHESPGLETLLVDGEARMLRCLNAQGALLWQYNGSGDTAPQAPFHKTLRAPLALTLNTQTGQPSLAFPDDQGGLRCVDAALGQELWRIETGRIVGPAVWSDLDGDGSEEVLAATVEHGVAAWTGAGVPLWTYRGDEHGRELVLDGPLAAGDIDRDGSPEVFAVDRSGPFCLDAQGLLRWQTEPGDRFQGLCVAANIEEHGAFALFCTAQDAPILYAFGAEGGEPLWTLILTGPALGQTVTSLAPGDLDHDAVPELIVGDSTGQVHAVSAAGKILWTFQTGRTAAITVSLGDVDGDAEVDILAASRDAALYALDRAGALTWRYQAARPLLHPPALADIDQDGETECLFGAGDGLFRCLTLGGRYAPVLMPWPTEGGNVARTGVLNPQETEDFLWAQETRPLLENGGFDEPAGAANPAAEPRPRGWMAETPGEVSWSMDTQTKLAGAAALKVVPNARPVVIVSAAVSVAPGLRTLNTVVMANGPAAAQARLRWHGRTGIIAENPLRAVHAGDGGWTRFLSGELRRPLGAQSFSLVLVTDPANGQPAWWDQAQVNGSFKHLPQIEVFSNQVGYEVVAPKRFTVRSNFLDPRANFRILDNADLPVYEGTLTGGDPITTSSGPDWPGYYWRGDFSSCDETGTCRIEVLLGSLSARSHPFEIDYDLLWEKTAGPAAACFTHHRCGTQAPGYHPPCHLDDAVDGHPLAGGWHDGSSYDKRATPACLWQLACAYAVVQWRFTEAQKKAAGYTGWLEEILWGADLVSRSIRADGSAYPPVVSDPGYWGAPQRETDNKPSTGDERALDTESSLDPSFHAAALARTARLTEHNAAFVNAAKNALHWALENDLRGPLQFNTAMDLFMVTREQRYADLAQELFPGPHPDCVESLIDFENEFDAMTSFDTAVMFSQKAEALLGQADNPFGVYTYGAAFFDDPRDNPQASAGHCAHILDAAALAAKAFRFHPTRELESFIYDQFNWILGNNPYGISLMEGVGVAFLPTYHHRYAFAGLERGAVPGAIANGIAGRAPGDDRPWLDLSGLDVPNPATNGCALHTNALYLSALANLKRIRGATEEEGEHE